MPSVTNGSKEERRFLVKRRSPETKEKIRKSIVEYWNNPETKEKRRQSMLDHWKKKKRK